MNDNTSKLIRQVPLNSTFMGVMCGALNFYGIEISPREIYVETGYFAALNIHPTLCPSGPYCWNHQPVLDGLKEAGLDVTILDAADEDQATRLQKTFENIREAHSNSLVVQLGMEFQLVTSVDDSKMGLTLPWNPGPDFVKSELSVDEYLQGEYKNIFGWWQIKQCPQKGKKDRLHSGLKRALSAYEQPSTYQQTGYQFGIEAYETWITGLSSSEFDPHGHWWNAMVWSELRQVAAKSFRDSWYEESSDAQGLSEHLSHIAQSIYTAADRESSIPSKIGALMQAQDHERNVPALLMNLVKATATCT